MNPTERALEFDTIRRMLQELALCERAKERLGALAPTLDEAECRGGSRRRATPARCWTPAARRRWCRCRTSKRRFRCARRARCCCRGSSRSSRGSAWPASACAPTSRTRRAEPPSSRGTAGAWAACGTWRRRSSAASEGRRSNPRPRRSFATCAAGWRACARRSSRSSPPRADAARAAHRRHDRHARRPLRAARAPRMQGPVRGQRAGRVGLRLHGLHGARGRGQAAGAG